MFSTARTYSRARLHWRGLPASALPTGNIAGKVSKAHLPYVDLLLGVDEEGSPGIQVGCLLWGDHLGDQVGRGSWRLGGHAVEAAPLDGHLAPLLPVEQLQAGHGVFRSLARLHHIFPGGVDMAAEEQLGHQLQVSSC